jgi:glyoxylase-like metal-dependent hydrolase (beta-lactamase superfamily II)
MDVTAGFPRQLTDGLWVVGNYFFNLYLVKGEQASALIEVGVSGMIDGAIEQMESLGVRPAFIIATHPHSDHITGLATLKEKYPQALVIAGEGAPEFLAHPKAAAAMIVEDQHMSAFLAAHGIAYGRAPIEEPPSLENCLVAQDGHEMDIGGLTLRFFTATGHSPGKVVVQAPEIDALILSDSLGFRYPGRGVLPLFLTNYIEYMATLDRLEALKPAVVGVAHQGPLVGTQVHEAFEESREVAAGLRNRIVADTRITEEIINDLFNEFYRDELTMYTPENIMNCCRLLVKRAKESADLDS